MVLPSPQCDDSFIRAMVAAVTLRRKIARVRAVFVLHHRVLDT
jgi:hypothetical protein